MLLLLSLLSVFLDYDDYVFGDEEDNDNGGSIEVDEDGCNDECNGLVLECNDENENRDDCESETTRKTRATMLKMKKLDDDEEFDE